jgi:hypothetical protein
MGALLIWATSVGLVPFALWFWARRLKKLNADLTFAERERAEDQLDADAEERAVSSRLALFRDCLLAVISIGLIAYVGLSLSPPALEGLAKFFGDIASALNAYDPLLKGGQMDSIVNASIRVLLSTGAFLIVFGLCVAFLPGLFPHEKGSRMSNYLSYSTSFVLAAVFALWLGSSATAFGIVLDQLTKGFMGIVTTFLSILFGAIGVYLLWRQFTTMIRPK